MKLANLGKRLLFVLWAAPLGWWAINSHLSLLPKTVALIYPGHVLAILLTVMAFYEYFGMLKIFYPFNGFWLGYLWLGLQLLLYFKNSPLPSNLGVYLLLMLVAFETFIWGKRNLRRRWVRASLLFSGTLFLYIAGISMLNLYREPFQSLFRTFPNPMLSQLGIVIVLGSVFLCDSLAYFIGSAFGKHHFSTISPKKTIEGSVAGLVAAVLVSSIGWFYLANPVYPKWLGLMMGIVIGIFAQVGDLLVSLMKRYFRVKDASAIIPGHGGILDRFDSVFFTTPVLWLFSWLVSLIAGQF